MSNLRKERKDQTRIKLLAAASSLIKEKGFGGASVQKVMARAKLSHGAFYAYFRDKDRMIVEAVRWGMEQAALQASSSIPKDLPAEKRLLQFLRFYLSPAHRERVAEGCPVAALSREFGKSRFELRRDFARELNQMIEQRRALFSDQPGDLSRKQWIGIMCTYVGALILSRSSDGDPLSDDFLEGAYEFLERALKKEAI